MVPVSGSYELGGQLTAARGFQSTGSSSLKGVKMRPSLTSLKPSSGTSMNCGTNEDLAVAHAETASRPAAARPRNVRIDVRLVLPQNFARFQVDRERVVLARHDEHSVFVD